MKMLRKSKQECWPVGPSFPGKGGQYQRVQVLKREQPRSRVIWDPSSKRPASPFVSLCHTLTVRADNIVEAA